MVGLRPGRTTRKVERPYTRQSKRKPKKSYVVGVPHPKIHQFEMGKKGNYPLKVFVLAKRPVQIRHNALEASRIVVTKFLTTNIGTDFFFKILIYPHHVLRQKSIAMGAGADRFSQGMRASFGKPTGLAAQVKKDQRLIMIQTKKENLDIVKAAAKKFTSKIPTPTRIVIEE